MLSSNDIELQRALYHPGPLPLPKSSPVSISDSTQARTDLLSGPANRSDFLEEPQSEATPRNSSTTVSFSEVSNRSRAVALAPFDKGRKAWFFVTCSFVLEMLVVGFPSSFGVMQVFYLTHPPFDRASEATINSIGTIALALQYIEVPFVIALAQRRPRWVRAMTWIALAACSGSLLLSSFVDQAWHLIALQGVLFGLGGGFLYAPILMFLSEWFVQKRALAASVIFGGTAIGGTVFPFLLTFLLNRVGIPWTLRASSAIVASGGAFALLGITPRVPIAPTTNTSRLQPHHLATKLDLRCFKSPLYAVVATTVMTQALGYYPVPLYIPSYVSAVGLSSLNGTLALAAFNLATVVGQISAGLFCDAMGYAVVMTISALGSAVSAYVIWGFAHNAALIYLFVIVFGIISGAFNSSYPSASADIAGPRNGEQASMVFGSFGLFKGAAVISGPVISAALHRGNQMHQGISPKYGGYGFTGVILFVGSMLTATGFSSILGILLRARRS